MKLYTFLDSDETVIAETLADDHDEAVANTDGVTYQTDFYSEAADH